MIQLNTRTYDDLVAGGASPIAPPQKLSDYPGSYLLAEWTAHDTGAKVIQECETDEDVAATLTAAPPVRWLLGPAGILSAAAPEDVTLARAPG